MQKDPKEIPSKRLVEKTEEKKHRVEEVERSGGKSFERSLLLREKIKKEQEEQRSRNK